MRITSRSKLLAFDLRGVNIVAEEAGRFGRLAVTIGGVPVDDLTATSFSVTNVGTGMISGDDFASLDQLRLTVLSEFEIYDAHIVPGQKLQMRPALSVTEKELTLTFEYLNPHDSIEVSVLHSGQWVQVGGALKGGKLIDNLLERRSRDRRRQQLGMLALGALSLFVAVNSFRSPNATDAVRIVYTTVFGLITIGAWGVLVGLLLGWKGTESE